LTTVLLKKHQRDTMSIYGKFKFKDSLERNMLRRLWTRVNEYNILKDSLSG